MNCPSSWCRSLSGLLRSALFALAGLLSACGPAAADSPLRPGVGPAGLQFEPLVLIRQPAKPDKPHQHPGSMKGTGQDQDLTTLTIEDLLNQEVIPINVLGGHTHPEGQLMLGYRYMFMHMGGNLDGTQNISPQRILRRYVTTPTSMDMEMHMLELMYAPNDRLTAMIMVPYKRMWMDKLTLLGAGHGAHGGHSAEVIGGGGLSPSHIGGGGGADNDVAGYEQRSAGWGDVTGMALYNLRGKPGDRQRWLLNGGLSVPSGSIRQTHDGTHRHEYMMQLGSGTVDLLPGLTYLGEDHNWSWGGQALGTLRLGRNDIGYRQGHQFRLTTWASYRLNDCVAPSLRLDTHLWGNIHGLDPSLDPLLDPSNDPNLQRGRRVDLLAGVNLYAPKGRYKGHRITLEGGVPVYQSLKGPQLESDWQITLSWSHTR